VQSKNIRRLPAIDHLRGLAALLIVYYHGTLNVRGAMAAAIDSHDDGTWRYTGNPFLALVFEGHTAVAAFMVLSGFIFAFGMLGKKVSYRRFIGNRILRVYPLYGAMLVLSFAAFPDSYKLDTFLACVLFQANFPGILGDGLLPVAWAIAVEFQFYLLLPLLTRFVDKYGARYLVGLALVTWWFRLIAGFGSAPMRDVSYFSIVGRMDDFVVGMALGVLFLRRPALVRRLRALSPLGAAALLGAVSWFHRLGGWAGASRTVWYFWPTVEALGWGAFVLAYLALADRVPRPVSRLLSAIGTLSFSIYLMHYPILLLLTHTHCVFALSIEPVRAELLYVTVVVVPLTLLASTLTYWVVERPFLHLRGVYLMSDGPEPVPVEPAGED
jgi:peptidoglycan/LPS O-acetylase OafA/YrhL